MKTYVVTGRHRSGTTMMARAIHLASKLEIVHGKEVEQRVRSREVNPNYDPNPNGYLMPPDGKLPHDVPGKLIKVPVYVWPQVKPGNYFVVRIVRDEAERNMSFKKSFGVEEFVTISPYEKGEANLQARTDVTLITLRYVDVIENPLREFKKLKAAGWPIDPVLASTTVDPKLYRNKV